MKTLVKDINQPDGEKLEMRKGFYFKMVKRPMDLLLSAISLVMLAPALLTVAILVCIKLGRPVLFKQQRSGLNEQLFTIYKFRTMVDARDSAGELLPNEFRLTRFGRVLRSTSLDELPELINILRGDMSFIGPRPLPVRYLPLYNNAQRRRHLVRPGLSGLAQVNGRNEISWGKRFSYDIEYLKNITFAGDVKLLFISLIKVFAREGINKDSTTTMEPFTGN